MSNSKMNTQKATTPNIRFVILISVFTLVVLAGSALAETYYVSPTGLNTSPGTQAEPWSLSKANATLVAGDTAILMDGSYSTTICPANTGKTGAWITYQAQNSRQALLTSGNPRIQVDDRSHIRIDGIRADNGPDRWLRGKTCSYITINDCYFQGNGLAKGSFATGRFLNTGGHITITNSYFDGQRDGIHIQGSSGHYIANNKILADDHSPVALMGVTDSIVEKNYLPSSPTTPAILAGSTESWST